MRQGRITGVVTVARDVTDARGLADERERLVAAVEQTSDSVIISGLDGTIEYVNPAFERVSGYSRDEAVGQNPRILKSGVQSAGAYDAMWSRLLRGQTWTGSLVNRRKDGELYEEEATISPIRGRTGETTGYVAVKRDVTALRAAESDLAREFRERAEVAAALARLRPGRNAAATARDICDGLLGLSGIDVVAIIAFDDPPHAVALAVGGPGGLPLKTGRPVPASRAAYLHERASKGPWSEAWHSREEDGLYGTAMADAGIRAIAYAPIRDGDILLGVVAAGTCDDVYALHLIRDLPAVGEFSATASALLSGQLERGHQDARARARDQERSCGASVQPGLPADRGDRHGPDRGVRSPDPVHRRHAARPDDRRSVWRGPWIASWRSRASRSASPQRPLSPPPPG